jgi:hypothetical protein
VKSARSISLRRQYKMNKLSILQLENIHKLKGDILKTSHKTPPFVSKHYCKPTKPTQPTLPGFEDLPEDKK